jgi:DNA-binding MarR family transcriptional regulator
MSPVPSKKSHLKLPAVRNAQGAEEPAAAVNPLSLDAQLCFLLYGSTHAMVKVYKPVLDPLGLTYPQYLAMLVLWEADDVTVSALGERLRLDSGTLTPLLRRLAEKGLLTRVRDAADERRVRVQLSDAGRALRLQAAVVPEAMRCALGMDDEALASLRAALADLQRRLSQAV